jgi:GT2 family glycosyltransferase
MTLTDPSDGAAPARAPHLSVIIPAFNAGETIAEQMAALASQRSVSDWEVIIADNGSTDSTCHVVEGWSDTLALRIVDASARSGPGAARNVGARAARSRLLVFIDADDVVLPGWLEAWQQLPDDFEFGTGPTIPFTGSWVTHRRSSTSTGFRPPAHMGFLSYALGSNFGIRADVFAQFGGFDEELQTGEDVDLSWRLQLAGISLTYVPAAAVAKRQRTHGGQLFRQLYAYGHTDPYLFKKFRRYGIRRPPWSALLRTYAGLVARIPLLCSRQQRQQWLTQLGRRAGRMMGSLRQRTFYP